MTEYKPMPSNINWGVLIPLLRNTYRYGDGGLPAASGIGKGVLVDCTKNGVHSFDNGVTLWNLAVDRLSIEELDRCCDARVSPASPMRSQSTA